MPITSLRRTNLRPTCFPGGVWLISLVLLAWALPGGAPASEQPQWRARGTEQFRIIYRPADEDQARIAQRAATVALGRLQRALDIELEGRVEIKLCHTQQEFNEFVGEKSVPWVMGRAFPRENRVVVKALGPQRIGKLVAHELCHIVLERKLEQTGAPAPRWLHEGLAKYATEDLPMPDQQTLSHAVAADELLNLDELEKAFAGPVEKVNLAYAQSYTLVRYLAELNPGEGLGQFLEELGRVGAVDRALVRAYHQPVAQLEQQWLAQVRRAYMGRGMMDKYGAIIWIGMVGLFAVVVVIKLSRAGAIRRRMQQEERLHQLLEGPDEDRSPDSQEAEQ